MFKLPRFVELSALQICNTRKTSVQCVCLLNWPWCRWGSLYLDVRIRFYLNGTINNFHILAIPMRERHTKAYPFGWVNKLLDVIAPIWRDQLIGIASDGASDMTGCIQGTVIRLCCEAIQRSIAFGVVHINLTLLSWRRHSTNFETTNLLELFHVWRVTYNANRT